MRDVKSHFYLIIKKSQDAHTLHHPRRGRGNGHHIAPTHHLGWWRGHRVEHGRRRGCHHGGRRRVHHGWRGHHVSLRGPDGGCGRGRGPHHHLLGLGLQLERELQEELLRVFVPVCPELALRLVHFSARHL